LEDVDIDCRIAADSTWHPHQSLPGDVMRLLSERITARSYENYTNLRELYNGAAFAVVPLKQAPYACGYAVIAEAMAMAKAVIATRTHSGSDLIIEGETGFYVEPGDIEGLRERIVYLLHNPDVAKVMGDKARARVCNSFSLQHYCEAFERLIRERGGILQA
jgi:glycosyltransferase involved in cell wall biosynthesis